ncbi:hypothetical protein GALMADRAFT_277134 [Galerina marginata CBS 339.88]|uniref:Uncharacterized protein n=1 Tax=Galerina marginata (strain CBS 339.88) TaxID=685588 RepID=A0A067TFG0_GALM3|nr:hypothetical protein GALMADRAFT_277134 [Galerina marginata CBS 339.88]
MMDRMIRERGRHPVGGSGVEANLTSLGPEQNRMRYSWVAELEDIVESNDESGEIAARKAHMGSFPPPRRDNSRCGSWYPRKAKFAPLKNSDHELELQAHTEFVTVLVITTIWLPRSFVPPIRDVRSQLIRAIPPLINHDAAASEDTNGSVFRPEQVGLQAVLRNVERRDAGAANPTESESEQGNLGKGLARGEFGLFEIDGDL